MQFGCAVIIFILLESVKKVHIFIADSCVLASLHLSTHSFCKTDHEFVGFNSKNILILWLCSILKYEAPIFFL